jgi:primary-amine oxidase
MAEMRTAVPGEGRGNEVPLHPLDPLTAGELQAVIDAVRDARGLDHRHLFVTVQLDEPAKEAVVAWREGDALERAARVAIWDQSAARLSEGVVAVNGEIRQWREVADAMAPVLLPQAIAAIEATKADTRIREGLLRRGVENIDDVHIETWPFGGLVPEALADGKRLIWTPMWERKTPDDNQYAHPVYGLHAVVDLDTGNVVDVEDHGELPIPQASGDYRQSQLGPPRDLRDLEIVQPDGPSFTVDGWQIQWQKWSFRIGFCPREGLVIHDVRYDDEANERRIAHRMSIAELVIPYGDPSPGSYRKNAFDTGEVGVGYFTNSLELGCDCLGEIRYLDVTVADHDGTVRTIPNGICLHEEDAGVLWKHTDTDGHVEVRRSRRFVASSFVTVDNYEYGYFWYFYQDGSIEFEAKLTGIVLTLAADPAVEARHATEIAPGLFAPYHQHIFCARLDLDVDGEANTVVEVDGVTPPWGPENPYGGAFMAQETPLTHESQAKRLVDPLRTRYWKVINRGKLNHVGRPVGYKLVPGHTTYPLAHPDSSIGRRAAFMYHHLWVSPYEAEERYPAGEYPFQHLGGAGLPEWTVADRATDDTDVVVWYVFGTNHFPRSEDWPVMPVERAGFHLKPLNFFGHNPALDVPPAPRHCARDEKHA